jgi:SAM-dependent methyltransferase
MGIKLKREKKRNLLLSILFRVHKLLPLRSEKKLKLYLDLEWIFDRLAHETSFRVYKEAEHPVRTYSLRFIMKHIQPDSTVLDLGCKYGNISFAIAQKAKQVVGIDYDGQAIKTAQNTYQQENLSFVVADALEYLKKQERKFNVLILSHILEHIDQPKAFLSSYAPYFNDIYIEVPDFNKTYLNEYRKDLGNDLVYTDTDHVSEFDRFELQDLVEACGLKITKAEYLFGIQKIWCTKSK